MPPTLYKLLLDASIDEALPPAACAADIISPSKASELKADCRAARICQPARAWLSTLQVEPPEAVILQRAMSYCSVLLQSADVPMRCIQVLHLPPQHPLRRCAQCWCCRSLAARYAAVASDATVTAAAMYRELDCCPNASRSSLQHQGYDEMASNTLA